MSPMLRLARAVEQILLPIRPAFTDVLAPVGSRAARTERLRRPYRRPISRPNENGHHDWPLLGSRLGSSAYHVRPGKSTHRTGKYAQVTRSRNAVRTLLIARTQPLPCSNRICPSASICASYSPSYPSPPPLSSMWPQN
ncbi:hypothetical protein SBA3_3080001 [Candidatus Sulfopaludibacter sp. SbA3]|nr:hypothetical protein SBA3_3080001 [Candidatus Sulfopaludibacter sp. SbA3]